MANRYFRNTGSTGWGTASNWSATTNLSIADGAVPTVSDDVFLIAGSGNLNQIAGTCKSFNCTGYAGTYSGAGNLVVAGDITLSSLMTITWTGTLVISAAASINTAGKTLANVRFDAAVTFTLLADMQVVNLISQTIGTKVINGFTINVTGNFTVNSGSTVTIGTTKIILNGSGTQTWSFANGSWFGNDITIDSTGTIAFASFQAIGSTCRLRYIRGTISTGSVLRIYGESTCILDTSLMTWETVSFLVATSGVSTSTIVSAFNCTSMTVNNGTTVTFTGTASVVVSTLTMNSITGTSYLYIAPSLSVRVTTSLTSSNRDPILECAIQSSVAGTKAALILNNGATCNMAYTTFKDIDASSGRQVNSFNSSVVNCNNVIPYIDPIQSVSKSFAA